MWVATAETVYVLTLDVGRARPIGRLVPQELSPMTAAPRQAADPRR